MRAMSVQSRAEITDRCMDYIYEVSEHKIRAGLKS